MNDRRFRINWPFALLTAAFLAFAGYQSHAIRTLENLRPAVIATVDLERVFDQLDERDVAGQALQQMADTLQADADAQAKAIQALEEELALYTRGTEKHQQTLEKLSLATLEYQAFAEFSQRKMDVERGLTLKRLYVLIKEAAREEAASRGIDVIVVNDSLADIPAMGETETTRQISARRMLFTNPEFDITDELIARVNARLGRDANG